MSIIKKEIERQQLEMNELEKQQMASIEKDKRQLKRLNWIVTILTIIVTAILLYLGFLYDL